MTTHLAPRPTNRQTPRRRTAHLAAAVLAGAVLLATCAPIAAQATESSPAATASATATVEASPTATATTPSTKNETAIVGAGMLVAIDDATIFEVDGEGGAGGAIGELAIGESAAWSKHYPIENSIGHYLIKDEHGEAGYVTDYGSVYSYPQAGLKLDSPIVIRDATDRKDTLSGFGGRLGADAMTIRSAPSTGAEVLAKIQIGQRFMASAPQTGTEGLMGSSKWVAVLLDPDSNSEEHGWIRREATEVDKDPSSPEEITATTTDTEEDTEELDGEGQASAEPSATPTASSTAVEEKPVEKPAEPAAAPAPAETKSNNGLIIGGLSAVFGFLAGMFFASYRRKRAEGEDGVIIVDVNYADEAKASKATTDTKDFTKPGVETGDAGGVESGLKDDGVVEAAVVDTDVEDIDWDEED